MEPTLRLETPEDADAIHDVVVQAFLTAPHTSGTEAFIVRELRAAGVLTVSLVADAQGAVVGHVAISPVTISDGSPHWYGLGPVAVRPSGQRLGTGRRLIEEALDRLRRLGAAGCVVLGEPEYYGRFGFRADPRLVLEGVPPQYFQALRFRDARAQGVVTYHPAFEAHA